MSAWRSKGTYKCMSYAVSGKMIMVCNIATKLLNSVIQWQTSTIQPYIKHTKTTSPILNVNVNVYKIINADASSMKMITLIISHTIMSAF